MTRTTLLSLTCGFLFASVAALHARSPNEGRTPLLVWGVFRGEEWVKAYAEFERRHPDVKLILSTSGGRMDEQKLMCAIAGGSPPDCLIQDRFAVGGWASREAFIPLDDFLGRDRDDPKLGIRAEEFYRACWDEAVYKGKVYAIPNTTDDRILFYNEDLLKKEGFVDGHGNARPPRSWDDLEVYADKLTKRDEQGRITQVGFIPNYGNSWLYIYGWQNGGEFMTPDSRVCTMNEPRIVGALDWITKRYDQLGGATKVDAFTNTFQAQGGEFDPLLTGKVAMRIGDAPGGIRTIATYKPDLHFGVAPAPSPKWRLAGWRDDELAASPRAWARLAANTSTPRRTNPPFLTWSGGFSWAIPKGSRHPERAWELIKWMSSEECCLLRTDAEYRLNRARGRMFVPTLFPNKRINDVVFAKYAPEDERFLRAFRFCLDMMEVSRFRPVTPVGQLLWDENRRAMDQAIHHTMTPKAALDAGQQKVAAQLDLVLARKSYPLLDWRVPALIFGGLIFVCLLVFIGQLVPYVRQRRGPGKSEALLGYAFAGPWLVGFALLTAGPILASIVLSFCEYNVLHPAHFAGLDNYRRLPHDPLFWKSLGNTLVMVMAVPLNMAVGLSVAMLLNAKVRGLAFYRTVYYLPAVVPLVASSILWIWVLNAEFGLINAALKFAFSYLHLKVTPPAWLQDANWAKPALIVMGTWGAGAGMIIWLAGLKGIPPALYEAASLDGAPSLAQFRHVTIPMLSPYIFFNLIMGMITTFQIFTNAYIMTNGEGGPVDSTTLYVFYLFNNAFRYFKMGYASALAWVLFLLILSLTLLQTKLAPRWVYYEGGES